MNTLAHQNIKIFAHYLYLIEGCPQGRALEHWTTAEKQLNENLFRDNCQCGQAKQNNAKKHFDW